MSIKLLGDDVGWSSIQRRQVLHKSWSSDEIDEREFFKINRKSQSEIFIEKHGNVKDSRNEDRRKASKWWANNNIEIPFVLILP